MHIKFILTCNISAKYDAIAESISYIKKYIKCFLPAHYFIVFILPHILIFKLFCESGSTELCIRQF
jgi:hypothetical protein